MGRLATGFLTLLLALACGSPPAAVRADVAAYLRSARHWAPTEGETARAVERILATEFVDEALIRQYLAEAIPRTRAHVLRIRGYRPRTGPVASLHARYVEGWEVLLAGFEAIEDGFQRGDWTRLAHGRQAMARWRDTIVAVAHDLRSLTRRYGVDPSTGRFAESDTAASAYRPTSETLAKTSEARYACRRTDSSPRPAYAPRR